MLTFLQLLHFQTLGEILVTDAALVFLFRGVTQPVPSSLGDAFDFVGLEALAHLTVLLFQL